MKRAVLMGLMCIALMGVMGTAQAQTTTYPPPPPTSPPPACVNPPCETADTGSDSLPLAGVALGLGALGIAFVVLSAVRRQNR